MYFWGGRRPRGRGGRCGSRFVICPTLASRQVLCDPGLASSIGTFVFTDRVSGSVESQPYVGGHGGRNPIVVVVVVVVVLTLTRIMKSVVTGQAPVTLELSSTLGKHTNNPRWYTNRLYHS